MIPGPLARRPAVRPGWDGTRRSRWPGGGDDRPPLRGPRRSPARRFARSAGSLAGRWTGRRPGRHRRIRSAGRSRPMPPRVPTGGPGRPARPRRRGSGRPASPRAAGRPRTAAEAATGAAIGRVRAAELDDRDRAMPPMRRPGIGQSPGDGRVRRGQRRPMGSERRARPSRPAARPGIPTRPGDAIRARRSAMERPSVPGPRRPRSVATSVGGPPARVRSSGHPAAPPAPG